MRHDVLGLGFDNITLAEAVSLAKNIGAGYAVTPNAEMAVAARRDKDFSDLLTAADLVLPDGIGIIKGAKMLGRPLKERVAGIDFAQALMASGGRKIFLYGGKPGVAETAREKLTEKYPGTRFAGVFDGYTDASPVAAIRESGADTLFVCLGSPKQERWISAHRAELEGVFMVGLGGCLDVWSGSVDRAPDFWINNGLEWLYRLLKQPSRIGRALKLPWFLLLVTKQKISGG